MESITLIIVITASYLIGSVSFARLVTRLVSPEIDLSSIDMPSSTGGEPLRLRHYGANTASMKLGPLGMCDWPVRHH